MGYMSKMFVDTQRHHDHLMERNKMEGRKGNKRGKEERENEEGKLQKEGE